MVVAVVYCGSRCNFLTQTCVSTYLPSIFPFSPLPKINSSYDYSSFVAFLSFKNFNLFFFPPICQHWMPKTFSFFHSLSLFPFLYSILPYLNACILTDRHLFVAPCSPGVGWKCHAGMGTLPPFVCPFC